MPRKSLGLLLIALLASPLAWAQSARPIDSPASDYRISLNVDLVVLPITVHDRNGGFASNLTERDFKIYENGTL